VGRTAKNSQPWPLRRSADSGTDAPPALQASRLGI
jgi:hypothetical protein